MSTQEDGYQHLKESKFMVKENVTVPLSKGRWWNQQQQYYVHQGIKAWQKKIPYYATNNIHIANSYAKIILSFINEVEKEPVTPLYIVEMGAGPGVFSLYLLRILQEQLKTFGKKQHLVYVMTDMVEENVRFWENDIHFKTFIDAGLLDTAVFNVVVDDVIELRYEKKSLGTGVQNPVVFISNYVFDSLPQDIFKITQGKPEAYMINPDAALTIRSHEFGVNIDEIPNVSRQFVQFPFYEDEKMDEILKDHIHNYPDGYCVFPVGALEVIKRISAIASNKFLLLVTDKAFSGLHLKHFVHVSPDIVFHDQCFSIMVNLHAISCYFELAGGSYFHQSTSQGIVSAAFSMGYSLNELRCTNETLKYHFDQFGPGNMLQLFHVFRANHNYWSLSDIVSYLNLTYWDPFVFNICSQAILKKMQNAYLQAPTIQDLCSGMEKINENICTISDHHDTWINIGLVYQSLQQYDRALAYFEKAILAGRSFEMLFYWMGTCCVYLNSFPKALSNFRQTVVLNPNNMTAWGWIAKIKEALSVNFENLSKDEINAISLADPF